VGGGVDNGRNGYDNEYSSNNMDVNNNNNVNKFGNLIIPDVYGYFIRLNNGKIGIKDKYIKVNNGFSNLESVNLLDRNRKGFLDYVDNIYVLGGIEVLYNKELLYKRLEEFVKDIPDGMIISVLPEVLSYIKCFTICESMRIMNHINAKELSDYYYSKLIDKLSHYPEVGVEAEFDQVKDFLDDNEVNEDFKIVIYYRVWLEKSEYNELIIEKRELKEKRIRNLITKEIMNKFKKFSKISGKDKLYGFNNSKNNLINIINVMSSSYNSLFSKKKLYGLDLEKLLLDQNDEANRLVVKLVEDDVDMKIINVYGIMDSSYKDSCILEINSQNELEKLYIVVDKKNIMNDLKLFKEDKLRYYKLAWIDKVLDKNSTDIFVREIINRDRQKYYFKNNLLIYTEIPQFYPELPVYIRQMRQSLNLGSLDFETHLDSNNRFIVHAGAISYKINGEGFVRGRDRDRGDDIRYIEKYTSEDKSLIGDKLVLSLIDELFKYSKCNGYTIYSHNLGRFDGLYLLKL
jgi:hypothetical protein